MKKKEWGTAEDIYNEREREHEKEREGDRQRDRKRERERERDSVQLDTWLLHFLEVSGPTAIHFHGFPGEVILHKQRWAGTDRGMDA